MAATIYTTDTFADDETKNGKCTLREAIDAATRNVVRDACPAGAAPDLIILLAGTYTFNQGEYFSTQTGVNLTIVGQGSGATTVSKGFQNRFLRYIKPGGAMNDTTLEGFAVAAGREIGTSSTAEPEGAIRVRQVNLTLRSMLSSLNSTVTDGDGGGRRLFLNAALRRGPRTGRRQRLGRGVALPGPGEGRIRETGGFARLVIRQDWGSGETGIPARLGIRRDWGFAETRILWPGGS